MVAHRITGHGHRRRLNGVCRDFVAPHKTCESQDSQEHLTQQIVLSLCTATCVQPKCPGAEIQQPQIELMHLLARSTIYVGVVHSKMRLPALLTSCLLTIRTMMSSATTSAEKFSLHTHLSARIQINSPKDEIYPTMVSPIPFKYEHDVRPRNGLCWLSGDNPERIPQPHSIGKVNTLERFGNLYTTRFFS